MKNISNKNFIQSIEKKFSIVSDKYKKDIVPQYISILKDKFELSNKMILIQSDVSIKNCDTLLDICKIIVSVSASLLIASNTIPMLSGNTSLLLKFFVGSLIFLLIIFSIRTLITRNLINQIEKLKISEEAEFNKMNDIFLNIVDLEGLFARHKLGNIKEILRKQLKKTTTK